MQLVPPRTSTPCVTAQCSPVYSDRSGRHVASRHLSTADTNLSRFNKGKVVYSSWQMPHHYENLHATWDHTVLPGRGDILAFTTAEAGT